MSPVYHSLQMFYSGQVVQLITTGNTMIAAYELIPVENQLFNLDT